jgi:small subunit ribosomal protein S9
MTIEAKDEVKKKITKRPIMRVFPRRLEEKGGTVDDKLHGSKYVGNDRVDTETIIEEVVADAAPDVQQTKKVEIEKISDVQVKVFKSEVVIESSVDNKLSRTYATGKRKNAVARVWLSGGSGRILVNGRSLSDYLKRPILEVLVSMPFAVTNTQNQFDVSCSVTGGGLSGQAGAIRHAIARAMTIRNFEAYRGELKLAGLLTRDPRVVERKKPGLKKARKGQVFSKR